jgi:dTDP-4-dehydrorhamnose reductase
MLGRMVRLHLAADSGFAIDWTSRREEPGALHFQAESPRSLVDLAKRRGGYDYAVNCIAVLKTAVESPDPQAMAKAHQINAVFPHELAQLATETDFKLVHVSTDAVFAPESGSCFESDVPVPADLYGRTKLLGEPLAQNALTIRCSIIGPNPLNKTGLLEWVLGQPRNATIRGYDDQRWRGATTLQFAHLCARIFQGNLFQQLRDESSVHHFCPNRIVTKYQLLALLCRRFRPDIDVERASGGIINRVLESRGTIREICGAKLPMDVAIEELSTYIDGPKADGT